MESLSTFGYKLDFLYAGDSKDLDPAISVTHQPKKVRQSQANNYLS